MNSKNNINNIVSLIVRLQNLCEGFDDTNKNAILTTKIKILHEIKKQNQVTPSILKQKVGLAKSNLALSCNALISDGLIIKIKDKNDARSIYYSITEKGTDLLNTTLKQMKKNFDKELAYKNNMSQVNAAVNELLELVK